MDNGLIFPYRQHGAPDESGDANHPKLVVRCGLRVVVAICGAWDPIR